MLTTRHERFFGWADTVEYHFCSRVNRVCNHNAIRQTFRLISRIGDGMVWYALMLALPLRFGLAGLKAAGVMAVTGAVGLMVYKTLKSTLVRERPYIRFAGIHPGIPPLDRYSFPSGHTLHAVAFTTVAMAYFPVLGWILVPLALLIGASRVILGLHYPSDVLAGAAIGAALSATAVTLIG